MKWIFDLFAAGSAVLIFAYIIVWDIARIVYFIKCAGVKNVQTKSALQKIPAENMRLCGQKKI